MALSDLEPSGFRTALEGELDDRLAKASNLSDVADTATARTNLGLGTAATTAATDYDVAGAAAAAQAASAPLLLTETATKTANYTLALADQGKVVPMNGTDLVLTVPTNAAVAFPVGSVVNVYNLNGTDVEIKGDSGVTVRNDGDLAQYGEVSLRKRATDEWVAAGDLA